MLQEAKSSFIKMFQGIADFMVPPENVQVIEMREVLRKSKEEMDDVFQSVCRMYEEIKGLSRKHESFLPLFLASGDIQSGVKITTEKRVENSRQSYGDFLKEFSEIENDYNNACFSFADRVGRHIEDVNNQSIKNFLLKMRKLTARMEKLCTTGKEMLKIA